jgi:hypothetical protein
MSEIEFSAKYIVRVPSDEKMLAVYRRDLVRVHDRLKKCSVEGRPFQLLWPATAGIAASSWLNLIALETANSVLQGVWITSWTIAVGGTILAVAFYAMDRREATKVTSLISETVLEIGVLVTTEETEPPPAR